MTPNPAKRPPASPSGQFREVRGGPGKAAADEIAAVRAELVDVFDRFAAAPTERRAADITERLSATIAFAAKVRALIAQRDQRGGPA